MLVNILMTVTSNTKLKVASTKYMGSSSAATGGHYSFLFTKYEWSSPLKVASACASEIPIIMLQLIIGSEL